MAWEALAGEASIWARRPGLVTTKRAPAEAALAVHAGRASRRRGSGGREAQPSSERRAGGGSAAGDLASGGMGRVRWSDQSEPPSSNGTPDGVGAPRVRVAWVPRRATARGRSP